PLCLLHHTSSVLLLVLFFTDTSTTELYTLSLHDALPIFEPERHPSAVVPLHIEVEIEVVGVETTVDADPQGRRGRIGRKGRRGGDRKSTRLNSSHVKISYAVFCLKKKKKQGHDNGRGEE